MSPHAICPENREKVVSEQNIKHFHTRPNFRNSEEGKKGGGKERGIDVWKVRDWSDHGVKSFNLQATNGSIVDEY